MHRTKYAAKVGENYVDLSGLWSYSHFLHIKYLVFSNKKKGTWFLTHVKAS